MRGGAWSQDAWQAHPNLALEPGLRLEWSTVNDRTVVLPRLSARWDVREGLRLSAAGGFYAQSPGYEKLIQSDYLLDLSRIEEDGIRHERAAHAVLGELGEVDREVAAFGEALARVPESRYVFNNRCIDILAVAEAMMRGEIEYRRGRFDAAFGHLRAAVELDDGLPYDEPWGWMQPARHALAALLLEQGRVEEATAVYRADLGYDDTLSRACQHPDNVWSLHGFHECLVRRGKRAEAALVAPRLALALARTDVPIESSCLCRRHRMTCAPERGPGS